MPLSVDARIGSELLGYRIERVLGRGGMGVVYLAWQRALDRMVALKLLAPELAGDERFRERFLRESRLAASLDHPNIVPVHDAGQVDGWLYIAMRYVEGRDLGRLLDEQGALAPERTIALLAPIADALDTAHGAASCTGTSSPRTCSWTSRGVPIWPTSGCRRASRTFAREHG